MKVRKLAAVLRNYLRLRAIATTIWQKACRFDGMAEGNRFAEFSKGNPYLKSYDRVMAGMNKRAEILEAKGLI